MLLLEEADLGVFWGVRQGCEESAYVIIMIPVLVHYDISMLSD